MFFWKKNNIIWNNPIVQRDNKVFTWGLIFIVYRDIAWW